MFLLISLFHIIVQMTDTGVGIHLELSNDNGGTWNRTTSIPFEVCGLWVMIPSRDQRDPCIVDAPTRSNASSLRRGLVDCCGMKRSRRRSKPRADARCAIVSQGGSISNPSLFLDGGGGVRMLAQHRAFRPSHSRAVMVVGDR